MNQTDTPAKVASNDRLGPLPEYAHEFSPRWFGDDGGFTGEQMRLYALAAVAAERERLAAEFDSGREGDILRPAFVARWIRGA